VNEWVFPCEREGSAIVGPSLAHQHFKLRAKLALALSKDFVIHSLRHTMLTRLGEAGVEAFTIMRIAGHSSVIISQKYVHPMPEAMERAFEKLEAFNSGFKRSGGHTEDTPTQETETEAAQVVNLVNTGPLAQRLEPRTHNPLVVGSNPTGPTTRRVAEEGGFEPPSELPR